MKAVSGPIFPRAFTLSARTLSKRRQPNPSSASPLFCLLATVLLCSCAAQGQTRITLDYKFIDRYASRATIEAGFLVDHAADKAHRGSEDGDLHVAGRSDDIGLATVAEVKNGASVPDIVKFLNEREGGLPVTITGAWRIWTEHGGQTRQHIQGETTSSSPPSADTNPDHVFEIHPVIRVGAVDLLHTLRPIPGFKPKDAAQAFANYENSTCHVIPDKSKQRATIIAGTGGFNHTEFVLESLDKKPHRLDDGSVSLFANVLDLDGELLVRKRRMIFIKGTAAERSLRNSTQKRMRVVAIPRLNLALVRSRIDHAGLWVPQPGSSYKPLADTQRMDAAADILNWNLPYEMIVIAVLPPG
jgi:hypothetical protein